MSVLHHITSKNRLTLAKRQSLQNGLGLFWFIVKVICCHCDKYLHCFTVLGYSLLLCVVSSTQLPVLLLLILTSYCPDSASGLPFADDVQSSDAVTLVQPSVSSLLQTTLAPRVVQRRPCDPRTVRNLRKQLKNKAKTIRKLRLALREKKSGKKSDVQTTHHKSHYCFSVKKNSKRIKTYSSLVPAIRKKVIHLEKEIKSLQRWYKVGIVYTVYLHCAIGFRFFATNSG